ncbi:Mac 1 [Histomonas meleagridis]|uniref:Mac 1 n=1 Tax=Histomonas meleagridis TaxID=135588 RepID=UPI003559DDC8|nr:Mac 1 [Histomonas meleagridis]
MYPLNITSITIVDSIPNAYRRTGYNFGGWYYEYNWTTPVEFPTTFKQNLTLYPKWESLTQVDGEITFDGNGGEGTLDSLRCDATLPVNEMANTFAPPSNDVYFDGFIEVTTGEKVKFPYNFKQNVTFKVIWTKYIYYDITFHYNDGTTKDKTETYVNGTIVNEFVHPVRSKISFPYTITQSLELYARDFYSDETVSFDANGGFGTMPSQSYSIGDLVNDFYSTFHNFGYDFAGWYSSKECTEDTRVEFPFTFTGSITLYAKWVENIPSGYFLIKYNMNGGEGAVEGQLVSLTDNSIRVYLDRPPKQITNDGKAFVGWASDPTLNEWTFLFSYYQVFSNKGEDKGIWNLYAQWSNDYWTVTFDIQNGTGDVEPLYVDKKNHLNSEVYFPNYLNKITKNEAPLIGWSRTAGAKTPDYYIDNACFKKGTITEDITLFAVYEEKVNDNVGGNNLKYRGKTVWLKGITNFTKDRLVLMYANTDVYTIPWIKEYDSGKWWDCKKHYPSEWGSDGNMCWAAAASNALHWFIENNKHYIEKYYKLYPNKSKVNGTYGGEWDSGVFDDFRKNWPNDGGYAVNGFKWYISGSETVDNGGYFKDVFGDAQLAFNNPIRVTGISRKQFNEVFTQAFEKNWFTGFGAEYWGGLHAMTIYGVKYDDDGWIRTIYFQDSNDYKQYTSNGKYSRGIRKAAIQYFDENIPDSYTGDKEMYPNKNPSAFYAEELHIKFVDTFDLGTQYWEEFFEKHPVPEDEN